MSRRRFITGMLGGGLAAVAAGSGTILAACEPTKEEQLEELVSKGVQGEDIITLEVEPEQVIKVADFEDVPFSDYLELKASYDLPLGTLAYQVDPFTVLVLIPVEDDPNSRQIGFFDLNSGEVTLIVEKPHVISKNNVIYDARASRTQLIWVEIDMGDRSWKTYVSSLTGSKVGEARMVEEGQALWEPPMLAVASDKVYWTVMPLASGTANQEDSLLKAIQFGQEQIHGQGEPYTVLTSHGRMITNPLVSEGIITFVPRVDTTNVYYQLTALNCSDDKPVDFQVLPQSLRVSEALYMDGGFSFCIDDNYSYAKGLAAFGTYYEKDDGTYIHFARPPMSPPLRIGDCLVIKSTTNIVGIDLAKNRSFIVDQPPRCSEFGEALVGWGVQNKVVTCSVRVAQGGNGGEATMLRVFDQVDSRGLAENSGEA